MGKKTGRLTGRIMALTAECDTLRRVNASLVDRLLEISSREPLIIPPPDTSEIIKAVAELVNGWRTTVNTDPVPQLTFDDRVDREDIDEFVPPWEQMGPPSRGGWINPTVETNGNYAPYVPGAGNVTPPAGGVE